MTDYRKCDCPHCGQSIEYPAEGTGQTVPCPTCEQPFTLVPAGEAQGQSETQDETGWEDWIALNKRLAARRTKSGIPLPDESTAERTPSEAPHGAGASQHRNDRAESPDRKKHSTQSSAEPSTGNAEEHRNVNWPQTTPPATNPMPAQESRQRGKAESRFARLTPEAIRVKTNSTGDTPLHHAARLGRISEIPRHLLTIELFMVRNNHRQKHTPIHAAAQHGQLDKVPREFLNKVTMTACVKYENPDVRAKTETPLHVAVRCGHADQIPKRFFRPKFLSIAATCNGETVLHELAYTRRLDLVPQIYADSPMWDLKNSYGQVPREIIDTGLDAGQRPTEWKLWKPPTSLLPIQDGSLTLLPVFTHESLKTIRIKSSDWKTTYIVNLCDYTCSSPRCIEKHFGVPPRDFGRLCKHIILALREKHLEATLPPIARGIANNGYPEAFGVNRGRLATDLNGNPIYVTAPNSSGWLSVFALVRRGGATYYRWGYNTKTNEWTFTDRLGMNCHHINRNGDRLPIPKPKIHESGLI